MATRSRSCAVLLLAALALLAAAQRATAAPLSLLAACGINATATAVLNKNCLIRKTMTTADTHVYQAEPGVYDLVVIVRFAGLTTAQVMVGGANQAAEPLDGNRYTDVAGLLTKQGGSIAIVPYNDGLPVIYTMFITPRIYNGTLAPAHVAVLTDVHTTCCADDTTESCKSLATPGDICTDGYNVCNTKGALTQLVLPGELDCKTGLPASFRNLTTLETLDLTDSGINQEADALFAMFEGMEGLAHIHLARNLLSGPLTDATLQFLGPNKALRTIDISGNALAGTMPGILLGHPFISSVNAADNKLNGPIPEVPKAEGNASLLDTGSQLAILDLSSNYLNDTAETAVAAAPLVYLDLHSNNLQFNLPTVTNTSALVYYDVSSNSLSPSQFLTSCPSLVYVDVSSNSLNGGVGGLSALVPPATAPLRYFYAFNSSIFNEIPATLGAFATLREIDISGNQLSGNLNLFAAAIPASNSLLQFNASGNRLQDGVPDAMQNAAMFTQTTISTATIFSDTDAPAPVPATRVFDVSGNPMSGDFPMWMADAAARNAEADRQANYDPTETVVYDVGASNLMCPDTANEVKLDATGVIAIQNLGITCYDNSSKVDVGLQDALYKVVPGLPAPPPPPVKFITRPGPSKSAKTWKVVGICLGVLFALALVACLGFAYKWRDLDLKLKQRYHKQDGDEFKQNYVVSPRAADAEAAENGKHNGAYVPA